MVLFFPFAFHLGKVILQKSCQNPRGGRGCGVKRPQLRKWFACPTSHSENKGLQLLTHQAHLEKRGRPPLCRLHGSVVGDHPRVSYPQEGRKALSVVPNGKVFRLRPHGLNDVLIKRGSFFLENKTRHSIGRLQGHSCGGSGGDLTIGLVVSHETQRNERSLENILWAKELSCSQIREFEPGP